MSGPSLRADIMRPSALGVNEIAIWHRMLDETPSLQRAFFSPSFALACERATGRAYVAVLHDGSGIRGFLPFQFRSWWHERIKLAELVGGNLSQGSGLIAWPDLRTSPAALLRLSGLASLHLTHLMEGQCRLGLDADRWEPGYVTELRTGSEAFFAGLLTRDRGLVRDTERCLRRAEQKYGPLRLVRPQPVPPDMIAGVIAAKRLQYERTKVPDPFVSPGPMRLIEALNEAPVSDCRLVLSRLEAGESVLAEHLGIQYNDVLSYWFPVYDPEARSVAPGRLVLWYIIQHAAEDSIGLIDYGEGDAQYKQQFGTGTIRFGRAQWSAGNARALVARVCQSVEWRLQARLRSVRT
jgi:CelD/BcsL family acetyltransferase involved in cellulose biosynthesis